MISHRLLPIAVVAALTACAAPPAPKDTFYRLEVSEPARRFDKPPIPGVLEIDRLDTDGVLAERALAYLEPGQGLQRYRYDFWSQSPGTLMQDVLSRQLEAANAATRIVTPDLRVPPDFTLRGKLRRFEQVVGGGVAVEVQLALVSARNGDLVLMQNYSAQAPAASDAPAAAVESMGRAVSDILARFLADVAAADIPAPRR